MITAEVPPPPPHTHTCTHSAPTCEKESRGQVVKCGSHTLCFLAPGGSPALFYLYSGAVPSSGLSRQPCPVLHALPGSSAFGTSAQNSKDGQRRGREESLLAAGWIKGLSDRCWPTGLRFDTLDVDTKGICLCWHNCKARLTVYCLISLLILEYM